MTTTSRFAPALLAVVAACATSAPRPASDAAASGARAQPSRAASASATAPDADSATGARAQRLFAEALQAQEDQKKLNVPTDWSYLERKWRAAADAGDVAEAHFNLGVALDNQGKPDEARVEYDRALALKPSLRQAAVNRAVLVEKAGDPRAAAAAYAQVVHDFPEDALARERLAALYQAAGQLDEAGHLAREALLRDSSSLGAYKVLARIAVQRGDLDVAKLIALRAQKLNAKDPELAFLNGQVLARQGDDAGAAVEFRRALASGEYPPARHALLEGSAKKQAWGAVAEHARAILRVEPKNAPVHLLLGIALRHLGKPDEALASYAQAEKVAGGTLPEVYLARGVLEMRVKNACEPAIASFRAYTQAVGPVLAAESPAPKLERECQGILDENRKATEAAKQMQAEAEKKAAAEAAKKANAAGAKPDATKPEATKPESTKPEATKPADGSAAPTSAQTRAP